MVSEVNGDLGTLGKFLNLPVNPAVWPESSGVSADIIAWRSVGSNPPQCSITNQFPFRVEQFCCSRRQLVVGTNYHHGLVSLHDCHLRGQVRTTPAVDLKSFTLYEYEHRHT